MLTSAIQAAVLHCIQQGVTLVLRAKLIHRSWTDGKLNTPDKGNT
jgi:hypothetical protein